VCSASLDVRAIEYMVSRYDSQGVFSSPRALFMFRAFGHENSSVLAGGLPRWELEGHPVDDLVSKGTSANYPPPALRPDEIQSKASCFWKCTL
jgi:thiosulfate/3-mercaptopyruvate sulfurtransferase